MPCYNLILHIYLKHKGIEDMMQNSWIKVVFQKS